MARRANWHDLLKILRAWLSGFDSVEQAVKTLSAARIPAVPMLSPEEVIDHPQLAARAAFPEIEHRGRGHVRVTALPFHVDRRPVAPGGPAPYRVGEHTRKVLAEIGYDAARIEALRSSQVVEIPD
jgi:crotonobetainyl-CoA:carnitine CoA-transferase CaiB-like acyl-CoA transferase